jgi:hypothetical protein
MIVQNRGPLGVPENTLILQSGTAFVGGLGPGLT